MDPKNKSSLIRTFAIGIAAVGCAGILLWSGAATRDVLARVPNKPASKPHKATLRVSDSPDACRVVVTADQLLNNYEAYRRGDRFYIKIPTTSVPPADTIRGQAFSDVRVEQGPGGTIISFCLHADASARVDQRGNKMEIVFLVSRPRLARAATANRPSLASREKGSAQNDVHQSSKARISPKANKEGESKTVGTGATTPSNGSAVERRNDQTRASESARTAKAPKPETKLSTSGPVTAKKPTVKAQTANPETNPGPVSFRESANYWFSPAQTNRLTVGLGAALLISAVGFAFLKRRSTRTTRTLPTEAKLPNTTEVEAVIPEVSATVTSPSPAVKEDDAQERTVSSPISKLILDNTHRADVMNSRAPEDRRAIETSLLNIISADETNDDERRRAREALEQYGFVAQHNATLLKGRDAWERSSAARALGTIGSKGSLPFLIEALNDSDSIVRNEVVASIAALKDPAAIGALVEASRKHPDLAASLLSQTLNACSVDSIEWSDSSSEATTIGQTPVPESHNPDAIELAPEDMRDGIISGWLALVDNPNDEPHTEDVMSAYMLPQIERAPVDGRYLRIVA